MYGNPFVNVYNPQPSVDRINDQISQLENMKKQLQQPMQQPTSLTQNFQITPSNNNVIRYANSIEDVQKNMVIGETPFFSNDMSVVWIKDTQNNIKVYELKEIIQKDDKDLLIESLQMQLNEMKGMINNAKSTSGNVYESTESKKSTDVQYSKPSNAKQK